MLSTSTHFRYACVFMGLFALAGIVSYIPLYELEWRMTHYLFNYEFEFVKRGLIGEVLRLTNFPITAANLILLSFSTLILFAITYVLFFLSHVYSSENQRGAWLFLLLATTHSATLQHFIFDVARFDHFLYLLLFVGLWWIKRNGSAALLVAFLTALMVLIHEAAFFITIPIFLSYWLYEKNLSLFQVRLALMSLWVTTITFLVSYFGQVTLLTFDGHLDLLNSRYSKEIVNEMSLRVLHERGLLANIIWALEKGFTLGRLLFNTTLFLFCLLPLFYFFRHFFKQNLLLKNWRRSLLIFSSFSPLCLYFLGHDYARWWALTITNFFIVLGLICYKETNFKEQLVLYCQQRQVYLGALLASSILLGAVGVVVPFSVAFHIFYFFA